MRVLILGADGYLGWPTCMYFSKRDHEVIGIDNYFRRRACLELNCESLISNPNLHQRARVWNEITGKKIQIQVGDITDYNFLKNIFQQNRPDAVIHYAEQPSAPYSMIDREKAAVTLSNNLISTLNVAYAVKETNLSCQIIKLGTMGEYGTPNIAIEEGWIDIEYRGRRDKFLFPRQASSLYHTTKIQDTDLLWFYVRTWGLRVTDLMQGPVYGLSTDEVDLDDRFQTNFNYDEIFGTVLNRFVTQAVVDYPLTVYGKGNQRRGFINIRDTLQCVYLSARHPAEAGELRIFNQITEVFSINELAEKIKSAGDRRGYNVRIDSLENPRVEKEDHYYNPRYSGLLEIGVKPHLLTENILDNLFETVGRYKENINKDAFTKLIKWR